MAIIFGTNGNDSFDDRKVSQLDRSFSGLGGNDAYFVTSPTTQVIEFSNDGIDQVQSTISFILPDNVEDLILASSSSNISGIGNELDNIFLGDDGNNILLGRGGNDALRGEGGINFLDGGDGFDTVAESVNGNVVLTNTRFTTDSASTLDNLQSIENANLTAESGNNRIDASAFTLGGVTLTGANGNDILLGGSGNDVLDGGGGADELSGGAGNDFLVAHEIDILDGGTGIDRVLFQSPGGTVFLSNDGILAPATDVSLQSIERAQIEGIANADHLDASKFTGSSMLRGFDGDDILTGGSGSDDLRGDVGNDILTGGAGNDTFAGGKDNDSLIGGSGVDLFTFSLGDVFSPANLGIDAIADFQHGTDKIGLDKKTFITLKSSAGNGFSVASEFAIVTTDTAAATSRAQIVYNSSNGKLFYNQNGATAGFGTGAQFAILQNKSTLSASDFVLQSASIPIINGSNKNDTLTGTDLGGILNGFGGDDTLLGRGGDDTLLGGNGNDGLDGGTGDDLLFGGKGNDRLKGGAGRDTFVLARNNGLETIKDFDFRIGEDQIGLTKGLEFSDLRFVQQAKGTLVKAGHASLAFLNGVQANLLSAPNFSPVDLAQLTAIAHTTFGGKS